MHTCEFKIYSFSCIYSHAFTDSVIFHVIYNSTLSSVCCCGVQFYGFVLYRHVLSKSYANVEFTATGIRDRGHVLFDGVSNATISLKYIIVIRAAEISD